MHCGACGLALSADKRFCAQCGAPVSRDADLTGTHPSGPVPGPASSQGRRSPASGKPRFRPAILTLGVILIALALASAALVVSSSGNDKNPDSRAGSEARGTPSTIQTAPDPLRGTDPATPALRAMTITFDYVQTGAGTTCGDSTPEDILIQDAAGDTLTRALIPVVAGFGNCRYRGVVPAVDSKTSYRLVHANSGAIVGTAEVPASGDAIISVYTDLAGQVRLVGASSAEVDALRSRARAYGEQQYASGCQFALDASTVISTIDPSWALVGWSDPSNRCQGGAIVARRQGPGVWTISTQNGICPVSVLDEFRRRTGPNVTC